MSHPSRLALDRLALGAGDDATKAHAAGCAECQAHLSKVQVELPVPQWVKDSGERRSIPRWIFALAAVAALVIATVLLRPQPALLEKGGSPEAVVWLKHHEDVRPWAGETIHAGDSVRLEIAAGGYTQLTVVDLGGDAPEVVLRQPVSGHGLSTGAFAFDAAPGPERMAAILSKTPLTDDDVRAALDGKSTAWTKTWIFPKETAK